MDEKSQKLSALLSLYSSVLNDITFYQNQGDSTSVMNVIPVVIVPLLDLFSIDRFIITLVCLFAPCIQCLSIQRGLQAHTFVAMLRGYASAIEESINELIADEIFVYNSHLIDRYIASQRVVNSKGVKISHFITFIMHFAILGVCISFFIWFNIGNPWWVFAIGGLWFLGLTIFIAKLCYDFSKKEQKGLNQKSLFSVLIMWEQRINMQKFQTHKLEDI